MEDPDAEDAIDGTGAAAGTGATGVESGAVGTGATDGTVGTEGAATNRIVRGPPIPGRSPGMPNCSDSTSPCSSRDTSTPAASRRSEAAVEGAARAAVALCMLVVGVETGYWGGRWKR